MPHDVWTPAQWDAEAATFAAAVMAPMAPVSQAPGLDAAATESALAVLAGQKARFAPPPAPSFPEQAVVVVPGLPWTPERLRGMEAEAFAGLPRAWRPTLAARMVALGVYPHPDAYVPSPEDGLLDEALWRCTAAAAEVETGGVEVLAALPSARAAVTWIQATQGDGARRDAWGAALWDEGGATVRAALADACQGDVGPLMAARLAEVASSSAGGPVLRRAARTAASRLGLWDRSWPRTDSEEALRAYVPVGGLRRLLGRKTASKKDAAIDFDDVVYAALEGCVLPDEITDGDGDGAAAWWAMVVRSAPLASFPVLPHRDLLPRDVALAAWPRFGRLPLAWQDAVCLAFWERSPPPFGLPGATWGYAWDAKPFLYALVNAKRAEAAVWPLLLPGSLVATMAAALDVAAATPDCAHAPPLGAAYASILRLLATLQGETR